MPETGNSGGRFRSVFPLTAATSGSDLPPSALRGIFGDAAWEAPPLAVFGVLDGLGNAHSPRCGWLWTASLAEGKPSHPLRLLDVGYGSDSPGQRRACRRLPKAFFCCAAACQWHALLGLWLALKGPRKTPWASAALIGVTRRCPVPGCYVLQWAEALRLASWGRLAGTCVATQPAGAGVGLLALCLVKAQRQARQKNLGVFFSSTAWERLACASALRGGLRAAPQCDAGHLWPAASAPRLAGVVLIHHHLVKNSMGKSALFLIS